jgi:RNA polymerase sigma-70 factor (family 1)
VAANNLYNESEVLLEVAQGSETAFSRLVEFYKNNLYTSAWRITGSKAMAEDVLQNVFLKVWMHRERLPALDNFSGYLFTMTQNAIFDALRTVARRRERSLSPETDDALFSHCDTEQTIEQREYDVVLHRAIESLPSKQKQTYILIKQEGLKRSETANLLNVSPETVKFNLEEATRKIKAFCRVYLNFFF